ncbi:MAG: hypothetical protein ACLPHP_17570 [Candidatus Sulfotelmatobacter sp.]
MFGPDGSWARFLGRAEGFIATELKCESLSEAGSEAGPEAGSDGRYRVRDFWKGHRGFEIFRERFSEDFAQFDRRVTDELVEKQEFVGAYYEADGDE